MKLEQLLSPAAVVIALAAAVTAWEYAATSVPAAAAPAAEKAEPTPAAAPILPTWADEQPDLSAEGLLERLLSNADSESLRVAREDIARSADAETVAILTAKYHAAAPGGEHRARILETVRVIANPPATAALVQEAAGNSDRELAMAAATALAKIGTVEAVIGLTEVWSHSQDARTKVELTDLFRGSEPLPECRGLLETLGRHPSASPWAMAAYELAGRTPEPEPGAQVAAVRWFSPAPKPQEE